MSLPFNSSSVNKVSSAKYLGMMLDDKLLWECHISYICKQCSTGIGMILGVRSFLLINWLMFLAILFIFLFLLAKWC